MEISVTGKQHFEITPAIRTYAESKAGKMPRFFDQIKRVEVIAGRKDNIHFEVEMRVTADRTELFIAKDAGGDLYACIDATADKMERQLTDHKNKLRDHKR